MDFSHYIMHTIQHIIKCEQDIMTMMNQMFLFLTIRQLWRSIRARLGSKYFKHAKNILEALRVSGV